MVAAPRSVSDAGRLHSDTSAPVVRDIEVLRSDIAALGKPAVIGEAGFTVTDASAASLAARAQRVQARMDAWAAAGFSGAILWDFDPGWTEPECHFDARSEDPLLGPDGVLAHAPW